MAVPMKRAAAPPPPAPTGPNILDMDLYAGGFVLPEGDYVIADMKTMLFTPTGKDGVARGQTRLGVMITFLDAANPEAVHEQFYSMGSKAHLSFMPNEDGSGVLPVPNGTGQMPSSTNWAIFLQSLYDCALPKGALTSLTELAGTWVHMAQIPEPEERKGFASMTSEAADQQQRGPKKIAICTEIKEDGQPWNGTGGIPETAPAAKPNGKAAIKTAAPKPAAAAAPRAVTPKAPPAPAPTATEEVDLETAAINGISTALEASPAGMAKAALRPNTFKALKASVGEEVASAVIDAYFSDDATLNGILNQLSYGITAGKVVPL